MCNYGYPNNKIGYNIANEDVVEVVSEVECPSEKNQPSTMYCPVGLAAISDSSSSVNIYDGLELTRPATLLRQLSMNAQTTRLLIYLLMIFLCKR